MEHTFAAFRNSQLRGSIDRLLAKQDPKSSRLSFVNCRPTRPSCRWASVGAPSFDDHGARFISHLLIDECGATTAVVRKRGLTDPEATFFARGASRSIGSMHGVRCSAVICREVEDLELIATELPPGAVDLIFVPGALRQDPDKPRTDPPDYVRNIQRLAQLTKAYVVQTNWPNALNRPEESVEGGASTVAGPDGEILFRLPGQASGVGIFMLGERHFDWHPQ